jgi:glucose-6-phosphate 1-epimerase
MPLASDPLAPDIVLEAGAARAAVRPGGAHVASWRARGEELLFVSREAVHAPGAALRGGVPVVFPQFADRGDLPKHGFARTARWSLVSQDDASAVLELRDSEATRALWPHAFRCTLRVALAEDALALTLAVENPGPAPLSFTAALHTYLRVRDVHAVAVEGLSGVRYLDKLGGGARREQRGAVRFEGPVDRVYEGGGARALSLTGSGVVRPLRIETDGFADVVVWNPWREGAEGIGDMAAGEYRRMVCVEAAQVTEPAELAPGARWQGTQRLAL